MIFPSRPDRSAAAPIEAARLPLGWVAGGSIFLLAAVVGGVTIGPASISWWDAIVELFDMIPGVDADSGLAEAQSAIVTEIRFPRVVLGAMVGGLLSITGAAYQGAFRNPLADPYLLGVAAGAGLGATLAIVNGLGDSDGFVDPVPLAAFAGALAAVAISYAAGHLGGRSTVSLVLAGVAVASFLTALQTYVLQANNDVIREVYSWILGRLATSGWGEVALLAPYFVVTVGIVIHYRHALDVLSVGDEEAAALGLDPARTRGVVVVVSSLGATAAVSVSGLIGFVGIIVPHAVRLLVGVSHRAVLPMTVILGATFMVMADLLARIVVEPAELPIGVVTAMIGTPFFVLVLRASTPGHLVTALSVEIRGMTVRFGDRVVLDRIDLAVATGSWLTVIGPNGAGKTSLLRALVGAVDHDGEVHLAGLDGGGPMARARAIALVPQTPVIPPGIRVLDYVLLGRTPHRGPFSRESRHDLDVVEQVLARLDLRSMADRDVRSLSGGERQRVVLGRAIAQQARLLLLDEPTTALDLGHQQDVLDLVEELRAESGLTVMATLHDLTLAGRYGDTIALLSGGKIAARGSPAEVLTEDNIATHFDARVRVIEDEGGPVVVPAI